MFDVDGAVRAWRGEMTRARGLTEWDLDELEDHLRAAYDLELHLSPDMEPASAFALARETLGSPSELSREFAKVGGGAWRGLLAVGLVTLVVSFFLPAHRYDVGGLYAFLLAIQGEGGVLGVLSALTNFLAPAALASWKLTGESRFRGWLAGGAMLLAATLNLWWLSYVDHLSDLRVGYFAWVASFALTGAALLLRAKELPAPERQTA